MAAGLISRLCVTLVIALLATQHSLDNGPELIEGKATAYCLPGITASGQPVRDGVCAMHDRELLGKTVIVYKRLPDGSLGESIGIYEVLDTGCAKGVIDVWCEDLEECQEFMDTVYENGCKGNIFYQIIEADG